MFASSFDDDLLFFVVEIAVDSNFDVDFDGNDDETKKLLDYDDDYDYDDDDDHRCLVRSPNWTKHWINRRDRERA